MNRRVLVVMLGLVLVAAVPVAVGCYVVSLAIAALPALPR